MTSTPSKKPWPISQWLAIDIRKQDLREKTIKTGTRLFYVVERYLFENLGEPYVGYLRALNALSVLNEVVAHRFGWSPVPVYVSLGGDVLVALGLFINLRVFKENSYGGASIETVTDQKVISTGPYALVRHPMYAGVLIMILGIPLALDAWLGLVIIVVGAPGLIWRILDEEKTLKKDLPGYVEYTQTVRYRLVPYLW